MRLINTQNVKQLAHEYSGGKRVGRDFLEQIDMLVEYVIRQNVRSQEDEDRKTLTTTEWADRKINRAKEIEKEVEGA